MNVKITACCFLLSLFFSSTFLLGQPSPSEIPPSYREDFIKARQYFYGYKNDSALVMWDADNPDNPNMIMNYPAGDGRGFLFVRPDDNKSYAEFNKITAQKDNYDPLVTLEGMPAGNRGLIQVFNSANNGVLQLFAGETTDEGIMEGNIINLLNPARNGINVGLGRGSNVDRGQIFIANEANDPRAGMFYQDGNTAIVFADVKNFRMDDPEVADQEIWYASLEGPEAGAYDRGTATLENGEVTVTFSEHFMKVVNENKMTVQLTPLSAESLGLAVVEKTATGFKVKELHKGEGNYSFDWMVHSQRTGFEDYQVVRKKDNSQIEKMMQDRVPAKSNKKIEMPQAPARDQY